MGDLDGAAAAYTKGLEIEPTNTQIRQGLQDVKIAKTDPSKFFSTHYFKFSLSFKYNLISFSLYFKTEKAQNLLAGLFAGDIWPKIKSHPQTMAFANQPDYVKIIEEIRSDPSKIQTHLRDQRVMATFGMLAQLNFGQEMPTGQPQQPQQQSNNNATPSTTQEQPKPAAESPKPTPKPAEPTSTPTSTSTSSSSENSNQKLAESEKQKGNELYKQKKFTEALEHYQKAIELDPNGVAYYTNVAGLKFNQREKGKSLNFFFFLFLIH